MPLGGEGAEVEVVELVGRDVAEGLGADPESEAKVVVEKVVD